MVTLAWTSPARAAEPTLDVGYHGDFVTHPGVLARGALGLGPAWSVEAQVMAYWHPGLMTLTQVRGGPAVRVVGPRSATWGAFAHVGVSRGFWTSPTYAVADGDVSRVLLAGDTWGVLAGGVELGHLVERGRVSAWAVRPQLGLRAPTFHGVGVDLGLDATVRLGGAR
jgi:hypothetical protein